MVLPGDEVDIRRPGRNRLGRRGFEVTAKVKGELVASATARLAAPKTAYAFPPGHPAQGHGMRSAPSKAARAVWDRADAFTRDALGFGAVRGATTPPA